MKIRILAVALLTSGILARAQNPSMEEMQSNMKQMQQTIKDLQQQIDELKKQQPPPAPAPAPPAGPQASGTANAYSTTLPANSAGFFKATNEVVGHASEVTPRNNFNDQQQAAERANDLTLDPEYRGFIPIPNTPALIQFNAKPRVDFTSDNRNSGNPDRFVTAQIPVEGQSTEGEGHQFNANARGSQLRVDVRAPDLPGAPRFYYENDFFASGNGMPYRVRQLYGQYFNVTAGWTYSVFEDPDAWPDTVDYEGPNAMIFARQPTLRYLLKLSEHWQANFGVQQPSSDIDTFNLPDVTPDNHAPDAGFNVRWEDSKLGHVQLATIFRGVGEKSPTLGQQTVLGWGTMAATSLNVFNKDSVQGLVSYGAGYFHFANDNFTTTGFNGGDAAFDASGQLKALPYFGTTVGYTHQWCDSWRSTATFGYVDLHNEESQGPLAYHKTYYASANVIYQIRKRLSVGLECLYGKKEDKSGATGDVVRAQLGIVWALF